MDYINIQQMEEAAKCKLDSSIYDFYAGGASNELTLRSNEESFDNIKLIPRVLTGVSEVNLSTSLLNFNLSFPIIGAPMAFQCLVHPDGEVAIAKALHSKGLAYTCSTMSTISLEEVAENSPGPNWFQLYVYKDRELTLELVRRAELSGYQGIMFTVDVPIMGKRERDWKNQFRLPENLKAANFALDETKNLSEKNTSSSIKAFTDNQFDASLTWKDVEWLKSKTSLPIILKGIMRPEDSEKAVYHGADAIVVSNHGGRQLDGVPSSIELLPAIAKNVHKRIPVLVDGGIRRGTDIVKALALGADCVLIGRPLLWGLALSGEEGVAKVLSMLCQELLETMILCGYQDLNELKFDKALIANFSAKKYSTKLKKEYVS